MRTNGSWDEEGYNQGTLLFDDGGMRGLAAALCWMGLTYRCVKEPVEKLRHPSVRELVSSLLSLPTLRKSQADDPGRAMVQRIIKQNVDAKKLPVSSFEWSQILRSMGNKVTVMDAIKIYNDSPEVHAHGSGSAKEYFAQRVHGMGWSLLCCVFLFHLSL